MEITVQEIKELDLISSQPEDINVKQSRFRDADWFNAIQNLPVIVGGLGSLGSWLSLYLSRCGAEIYAWDFDTVDEVNMAGQMYVIDDIGESKTEALKESLEQFADYRKGTFFNEKYTKDSMSNGVMFSCFDNMTARKVMFDNWCNHIKDCDEKYKIFIDARLTAETAEVFFVTPDRIDAYKATLFSDEESTDLPCSFKSTTHVATLATSLMFSGFTNYLANKESGVDFKEVPFKLEYSAQMLYLESR